MTASVRSRDVVFSPQRVWLNPPHPLPLYYHQPLRAPCLALHHQPQQHSLTRQTWPGRPGSLLPTAASSMLPLTWHHCYFRKITVKGDADSLISPISLLAYCCWLPNIPHKQAVTHTHTYTSGCQIDYRFSVSNPFTVPTAAAAAARSRLTVCLFLYQSEAFQHLSGHRRRFCCHTAVNWSLVYRSPYTAVGSSRANINRHWFCVHMWMYLCF